MPERISPINKVATRIRSMTVNDLYVSFQVGSVVALLLTFLFGSGAIIVGLRINRESVLKIAALETRLAEAQADTAKANLERAKLEQRVKRQGPRGPLLNAAHVGHDPDVLRFKGQRVNIIWCQDGESNKEKAQTAGMLWFELSQEAGWEATSSSLQCGGSGLLVYVSPKAGESTRAAAHALTSAMEKALSDKIPYQTIAPGNKIPPEPSDANTVVVLVNSHPMV